MREDIPYQDIVEKLNDIVDRVASDCVPDGRKHGPYWRGDCHGKVSVHLSGTRVGMVGFWQGQAGNAKGGGNLIHLIELAKGFTSHGEAVRFAKRHYLGIGDREMTAEERRRQSRSQAESERRKRDRERQDEQQLESKVQTVQSLWHEGSPIAGTLAEIYLGTRSIELSDLKGADQWPPSMRFHPSMPVSPDDPRSRRHPALMGGVQSKSRRLIAIWRVFLDADGNALKDRDGKKMKLGFGPAAGGAVRFGPVTPVLKLTEGMETGLGVRCLARPSSGSVWATLSTSGMVGFEIPDGVKRLEIYADGDRHRLNKRSGELMLPPGIDAARKLQERAGREGVECVIHPSPEPDDWLDVWQQRKKDEQRQRSIEYR